MMTLTIDPDDFLETSAGRVWTVERDAAAWAAAFAALRRVLAGGTVRRMVVVCGLQGAGKSTWIAGQPDDAGTVYFDAALPGMRHRKSVVDIARDYGVSVEAVWVRVPLAVALARNRGRAVDRVVPDDSIRSVERQFEGPTLAEGFVRVTVVD